MSMFQRPKASETEEDLLRQEEEFLIKSGKTRSGKHNIESDKDSSEVSKVFSIIGDIVEKNEDIDASRINIFEEEKGFPQLFQIDPNLVTNKKRKKSLFALQMEKKKTIVRSVEMRNEAHVNDTEPSTLNKIEEYHMECEDHGCVSEIDGNSDVIDNIKESVHKESLMKLSKMPEDEILDAQRKLYETLDPKLVEFLKNRGKCKEKTEKKKFTLPEDVEMKEIQYSEDDDSEIRAKLSSYVGERWVNIDFIEKEKLEWVGDLPDSKSLEPDQPYSARFDFKGDLQPFSQEIDVRKSLHHHGDEPERPGYTIQELYQFSRSTVLQQRILALNTLANIIRKTKLGYYDFCFDGFLLHKLLESDLFFLLRFSIDENSLIPAAINCLRRLLCSDTDEYCLDKLLAVTDDDVQPLLYDEMETSQDEEKELKDNTIINCDVIKGVLRTDLLVRITYILNNLPCDRETITNAILCFIRISRHSTDSSNQILAKSELMNFFYSAIKCDKPIYQGVKLFRLLVGQSKIMASQIISNYPINFLISLLDLESMTDIKKSDFYLLKLEILYLWKNLLRHGLMIEEFISWTPCCIRLLQFYIEKIDFLGEGDFDFELFSAVISLLKVCLRQKLNIDPNYVAVMYVILEKWLKQIMHFQKFNYAGLKALGNCFSFFIDYINIVQIDQTGLKFILKVNSFIMSLISSPVFECMTTNLIRYSHILEAGSVKRDPKNLPSLGSVYEGGYDFLKIVNNQSSLPFFMSFVRYLKCSYNVTHDCRSSLQLFANNSNIRKYVSKVNKMKKNLENWFNRYELSFLTDILQLFCIINNEDRFKLGFRLLPMCRVDETVTKLVLSHITNNKFWITNEEFFNCLYEVYEENIWKSMNHSDCVMRYRNDLVGEDWTYKILSLLKGKEAVAEVAKVLKFISYILKFCIELLERVPYSLRYYHLCTVFLTDSNVFDDEIQMQMKVNFDDILSNRHKVELDKKVTKNKSFYDLYTELITQYAGVSYGLHIFAKFVLFPLQNKFDVSFRKLLWFEYLHVLRVVTLPYPATDFIGMQDFIEPCETDESLLVAYLNSISNNVITKNRNHFVYSIAIFNVKNYLKFNSSDSKLTNFLKQKINMIRNERVRQELLN